MKEVQHFFGDDTTTITGPEKYSIEKSPNLHQLDDQDTVSFLVKDVNGATQFEVTASHFSSGNRHSNLEKFKTIITKKNQQNNHLQIIMGDINTEIKTFDALQDFANTTKMVIIMSALKIRKIRSLQDQFHKRMDQKDEYDSMFIAIDPNLVAHNQLLQIADQNFAWPHDISKGFWKSYANF